MGYWSAIDLLSLWSTNVRQAARLRHHVQRQVTWLLSPVRWRSDRALLRYRNCHIGERAFVIGNGPSLNRMDLSPLKREVTFGLNRIYLGFGKLGFQTTYLVVVNRLVLEQFSSEIGQLPIPKFVSWDHRKLVSHQPQMMYIRSRGSPSFSTDIIRGAWEGATVTYTALQLAYFMGFEQVILIGVDHSFETKGPPHKEIVSEAGDPDHFRPDYFGKGVRWQLPNLELSHLAYGLARQAYERVGRSILDATVDGKLDVFPKIPYEEIISTTPRNPFSPTIDASGAKRTRIDRA